MLAGGALEALIVGNDDFDEIEKSFDVFCAFEAVGVVRQEIRHAHFLSYCLDPQRPHGFGSECLRALMRSAAEAQRHGGSNGADPVLTALDVHVMDLDGAQVRREWRNIDLLIIVPREKLIVAVELKIDASEHSSQLRRYREIVTTQWPEMQGWRHLFLFVTKRGEDPSEDDGEGWLPVDMAAVASELDGVVRKEHGASEARRLLAAYLNMLRRHHLQNERLEELAAKIWSQHREALEFLIEKRPDNGDGIFGLLYQDRAQLAEIMSDAAQTAVVLDDSTRTNIRFAVPAWDSFPGLLTGRNWTASNRLLLLELAPSGDRRSVRLRFVIGSGDANARKKVYSALESAGVAKRGRRQFTDTWTRLATETLARELDDPDLDQSEVLDTIRLGMANYAKSYIPAYGAALANMPSVSILGEPVR
jgi:hypothetical protein